MMKRAISGVFLLIALGALGLILAGALTSGEQLIVRFLTAIIVGALGLYVISDLRLKADDTKVAASPRVPGPGPMRTATFASEPPPPQSTAAFMATVTGKRSTAQTEPGYFDRPPVDPTLSVVAEATSVVDRQTSPSAGAVASDPGFGRGALDSSGADQTSELSLSGDAAVSSRPSRRRSAITGLPTAADDDAGPENLDGLAMADNDHDRPELARADERMLRAVVRPVDADIDDTLAPGYEEDPEVQLWPLTPAGKVPEPLEVSGFETGEIEGLVAIFAKNSEDDPDQVDVPVEPLVELMPPVRPIRPVAETVTETVTVAVQAEAPEPEVAVGALRSELVLAGAPGSLGITSPFGRLSGGSLGLLDRPTNKTTRGTSGAPPTTGGSPAGSGSGSGADGSARGRGLSPSGTLAAASYTRAPLADIVDLRPRPVAPPTAIEAAIRSGELEVIASLIDQGLLSTDGPISDRDVRTMVYVAFTSSELRKLLLAGGTIDGDNSSIDLGEVEVFYHPSMTGAIPTLAALDVATGSDALPALGTGAVESGANEPADADGPAREELAPIAPTFSVPAGRPSADVIDLRDGASTVASTTMGSTSGDGSPADGTMDEPAPVAVAQVL